MKTVLIFARRILSELLNNGAFIFSDVVGLISHAFFTVVGS